MRKELARARPSCLCDIVCICLALAVALFAANARAQQADGFTLQDALRVMRAEHPALRVAELTVEAAEADVIDARLWTNPSASFSYTPGVRASSYDRAGYMAYGITQFLELSNAPGARKLAAQRTVAASQADKRALGLVLAFDVEAALVDLVNAERKVALVERALALLTEAAAIVDKRFKAGASPRYDTTRMGVTLATAHADHDTARADMAHAWAMLSAAVGPGMTRLHGSPSYPLDAPLRLPDVDGLLSLLEQKRPDLQAARQRQSAAEAQITSAKRSVWSGVGLSALGGFGAAPHQIDVGVGLSAAIPVIDRGQGSVRAAEKRALQAQAYQAAVRMPAAARISGLRQEVEARQRALEDYTKRAEVAGDEMLQEAQAGYLAGRFSVLELADAYSAWRDSRLRALDLAAAARHAEIDLGREVGVSLRGQEK
jgi:cobalt-zinc-cadmium efflux system outer membrane protein